MYLYPVDVRITYRHSPRVSYLPRILVEAPSSRAALADRILLYRAESEPNWAAVEITVLSPEHNVELRRYTLYVD